MQRGFGNHDAAHIYRTKQRSGRQSAGAPNTPPNLSPRGFRLTSRELERDGPARGPRSPAEPFLLQQRIYLGDDTVDFIRQRIALLFPFLAELPQRFDVGALAPVRIHLEACLGELLQRLV